MNRFRLSQGLFKFIFPRKCLSVVFSLLPVLPNHVNAEISSGTVGTHQQILEYLSSTYLYRRLFANPS